MSTNSLDIRIRALVEGLDELRRLRDGLTDTTPAAGAAEAGLVKIAGPMETLRENAGKLAAVFITLVAAYGLKESVDYAARTEVLGTTLNVVAKNAGYSKDQIAGYEKEVKGLGITTQVTREALTAMVQAGLELGPAAGQTVSQVAKLARAAQDLAVVTGENSSDTLKRLITNITQLDTVGLRYMGLTVNVTQAQEKFALGLGKTVEQLTQQQKVQAVTNEALEQAGKLTGAYEASMQDVGKQLASISRYQEELANSIGKKLLPAYFELVKAATDFLKVTEKIVASADEAGQGSKALADGSRDFFTGLKDLFVAVVEIGADILPLFEVVTGMFMSFAGEVLHGVAAILQLGDEVDSTGKRTSALGQAIKDTVLIPIGILIAGLKDGFTFLGGAISSLVGMVLQGAGEIIRGWGMIVQFFSKDVGASIIKAGNDIKETGKSLAGYGEQVYEDFSNGKTALQKFNDELAFSAKLSKDLAAASNFKDVEEQIRVLVEAKRQGTKSDVELAAASKEVEARIKAMGNEMDSATGKTKLTTTEVTKLSNQLLSVTKDSFDQFAKSISEMGLKLQKIGDVSYLVPLNAGFDKLSGEVMKLADNATTTGLQFREAFSKGLDAAKSLSDIDSIAASLTNAKNAGKELGDSNEQLVGTFEKVFAASLKAASTKDDYALLTAQVKKLGDEGVISGGLVTKAMNDINEKLKGTQAEAALAAKQLTELGKANLDVAKAGLGVAQADYDVSKARVAVWKAQNDYAKTGSDLSAQILRLAQLELTLAQQRAVEARLHYAEAQQNSKVILATQEQILATKRLERDLDNADLILALDAAKQKLASEQNVYEVAKQRSEKQGEIVIKTQEEILKQKEIVDQAQAIADSMGQQSKSSSEVASNSSSASGSLTTGASAAGTMSNNLMSASGAASSLASNLQGATAAQIALASAMQGVAAAQRRLDEAQGNGPSHGGVIGDDTDARNKAVKDGRAASDNRTNGGSATNTMPVNTAFDIVDKMNKGKLTKDDLKDAEEAVKQAEDASRFSSYVTSRGLGSATDDGSARLLTNAREALSRIKQMEATEAYNNSDEGKARQQALDNYKKNPTNGSAGMTNKMLYDATQAILNGSAATSPLANQSAATVAATAAATPVATPTASATQAATASAPASSKTITVNFTNDAGQKVSATVDANDEGALLALLKKAQGISSIG